MTLERTRDNGGTYNVSLVACPFCGKEFDDRDGGDRARHIATEHDADEIGDNPSGSA